MAVPYHTHTFEIPTATPQDMAARASNDKAVTPSVLGTAATADRSEFATAEQGKRADSAVQPETLGTLARKNKVVLTEIETSGAPSSTTFLSGNGWQNLTGGGDMTVAIYDPLAKRTDAFDMGNMKEAPNAKIMTADERAKIANLDDHYLSKSGGTINGDLTVKNSAGTAFAQFPPNALYPTMRFGYTGEDENYSDLAFIGNSLNIHVHKFGDVANFYDDGTTYFANTITIQDKTYWQPDGNIGGTRWNGGDLYSHIENRINACVTDSRIIGWAELTAATYTWMHLPSGYVVTSIWKPENMNLPYHFGGRQPQLFIANRGWFPLGAW
ncbi:MULTISPECIES: hypothetical protein [Bartonella]|uniref:hypothetical protein n=1 Tax=Bartonella TaxID=773 RepID=UPI0018DC4E3E|nr:MULTISPECIES: hypothetical protein [Bartonella]MBI0168593.1 hypothetical protein [Bartonella sp. W8167]MBI0175416.1 hypothetical protein [Bartonella apis]